MKPYRIATAKNGYLEIDGQVIDLDWAVMSFQLNAIPTAIFGVSVGRGGQGFKPAGIHRLRAAQDGRALVKFFVSINDTDGESLDFASPGDDVCLFEGYFTGLAAQMTAGNFAPVVTASHWLVDMDYSSALSQSSHPMNPSQYSYRASHKFGGAGSSRSFSPFQAVGRITPTTLAQDFWKAGLKPWFEELCSLDRINTEEIALRGGITTNSDAARALARFTDAGNDYKPLKLNMRGADSSTIAGGIWKAVQAETFDSFANTTLWGKLVGDFAPNFMFAVCPRIKDAMVVPFVPGFRSEYKAIRAEDYKGLNVSSQLQRTLRGVGVFSGIESKTGVTSYSRLGIGGWYSPEGVQAGTVMLKAGPRWLTQLVTADRFAPLTTGNGAQPIANAIQPGVVTVPPNGQQPPQPAQIFESSKTLFDKYAESLYAYEALRLRMMEFGGPLRFDIAPGSTVLVEIGNDKFLGSDALAVPLIGDVIRVTNTLNFGEKQCQATTVYNVGHVRTSAENEKAGMSLSEHPLWSESWFGAPLME